MKNMFIMTVLHLILIFIQQNQNQKLVYCKVSEQDAHH